MRLVACGSCHSQFDVTLIAGAEFRCHCGAIVSCSPHSAIDAPIQRCASCGALVALDAASCDYCHAAIVRDKRQLILICPECYARNAGDSRFCSHCGVEFRPQPLPAAAAAELPCPACGHSMLERSIGGVGVSECSQCSGLWIPGDNFDSLVKRAIDSKRARPSLGLGGAANFSRERRVLPDSVVYRRCPVCKSPMVRKNFARVSGVIVDWCGPHGTWLDADELEAIAAFIQSGGLERAGDTAHLEGMHAGSPTAAQIEAMVTAERLMAEERASTAHQVLRWRQGFIGRVSLGDLLRELLEP